jgi:HEAT repeat protein
MPRHRPDAVDSLYILCEQNYNAAVPALLTALNNRTDKRLRESAIFLLGNLGDEHVLPHLLSALANEENIFDRINHAEFAAAFYDVGEAALKPMLAFWRCKDTPAYTRLVAGTFLKHYLAKPL